MFILGQWQWDTLFVFVLDREYEKVLDIWLDLALKLNSFSLLINILLTMEKRKLFWWTNLSLNMADAEWRCAMQQMTPMERPLVLGHKWHESVLTLNRQEVLHPTCLLWSCCNEEWIKPSSNKYLFSDIPEQQPWPATDSETIFQVPASAQNLKDWLAPLITSLPLWARTQYLWPFARTQVRLSKDTSSHSFLGAPLLVCQETICGDCGWAGTPVYLGLGWDSHGNVHADYWAKVRWWQLLIPAALGWLALARVT